MSLATGQKQKPKPFNPAPIVATVVVLLVLAGFFALFLWHGNRSDKRARAEYIALRDTRETAQDYYNRMAAMAREAERLAAESEAKLQTVTNDLWFVLGRGLEEPAPKPEPRPRKPDLPAAGASQPDTAADATTAAPEPERKGLDIMTPEELAARHRSQQTRQSAIMEDDTSGTPPPPDRQRPPAPAAPVEMSQRPGLKQAVPEILFLARKADRDMQALRNAGMALDDVRAEAARALDATRKAEDSREAAKKSSILPELLPEARSLHRNAIEAAREIQSAAEKIHQIRTGTEAERERQRKEAEARRKAAEQQALAQREQAYVTAQWTRCRNAHLVDNAFAAAVAELEPQLAGIKTEAGRAALRFVVDRYSRMAAMKEYLVESINKQPFNWGWGKPGQTRDILSADDTMLVITGGKVRWSDADPPQMLRLLKHYVAGAKERTWEMAALNLAAAAWCDEFGRHGEREMFIDRAVSLRDSLRKEVDTLFRSPPANAPAPPPERTES